MLQGFQGRAADHPATLSAPTLEATTHKTDGSGSKGRKTDWLSGLLRKGLGTRQSSPVQPDAEELTLREQHASPVAEGMCTTPLSAKVGGVTVWWLPQLFNTAAVDLPAF